MTSDSSGASGSLDTTVTVVVMTRDRVADLVGTLERLTALPEQPAVMVADNGSSDDTVARVRAEFPEVEVVELGGNAGVAARNVAVRRARTPVVAFNDDDSWWAPGSLARVGELFAAYPALGAVTAHVRVEPGGRDDPLMVELADSPVEAAADGPGVPVLGFMACATAVRRSAFSAVGGFDERFHFGGEEELLATDLASLGWEVRYVPDVTVHHQPSSSRDHAWRRRRGIRNSLWFLWLRRPIGAAVRRSARLLADARPADAAGGLVAALCAAVWVARRRRVVPARVERQLQRLESHQDRSEARQYAR